jgi:hypothetical protein
MTLDKLRHQLWLEKVNSDFSEWRSGHPKILENTYLRNTKFVVTFGSKCHRLSLSLIDVNGITLWWWMSQWLMTTMDVPLNIQTEHSHRVFQSFSTCHVRIVFCQGNFQRNLCLHGLSFLCLFSDTSSLTLVDQVLVVLLFFTSRMSTTLYLSGTWCVFISKKFYRLHSVS